MAGRTYIVFTSPFRRRARHVERQLQHALEHRGDPVVEDVLAQLHVPDWARGARVEKAGRFQHAVVATEGRGR